MLNYNPLFQKSRWDHTLPKSLQKDVKLKGGESDEIKYYPEGGGMSA